MYISINGLLMVEQASDQAVGGHIISASGDHKQFREAQAYSGAHIGRRC